MTVARGPDFICIGAQKAGTTWLYDNLIGHPQVWMPPVKEIHFFDLVCPPKELLGIEVHTYFSLFERYRPFFEEPSWQRLRWLYRYHHVAPSTKWYHALYSNIPADKVSGDITPAYSVLDDSGVAFAHQVLKPQCRVILILRNPVERIWSGIKMYYRWRDDDIRTVDPDDIHRDIEHPSNRLRSDYPSIIDRWARVFGDRLGLFLYDDLVENPREFLHDVQHFLGIEETADDSRLRVAANADLAKVPIPEALKTLLMDRYSKDMKALEQWLPGVSRRWGF